MGIRLHTTPRIDRKDDPPKYLGLKGPRIRVQPRRKKTRWWSIDCGDMPISADLDIDPIYIVLREGNAWINLRERVF